MITSLGVDLSLNNSALVAVQAADFEFDTGIGPDVIFRESLIVPLDSKGKPLLVGMARLEFIIDGWGRALDKLIYVLGHRPSIVVFEGPGFSSQQAHSLGHVHGLTKLDLWRRATLIGLDVMGDVPPANLKQFATGVGKGDKNIVMKKVFRRWGFDDDDDNIVDAYVCSLIGLCRMLGGGSELQRKVATQRLDEKLYAGTSRRAQEQRALADRVARGEMAGRVRRRRVA